MRGGCRRPFRASPSVFLDAYLDKAKKEYLPN